LFCALFERIRDDDDDDDEEEEEEEKGTAATTRGDREQNDTFKREKYQVRVQKTKR
jgi:hypothetical protein